jgi:hypothetical protein
MRISFAAIGTMMCLVLPATAAQAADVEHMLKQCKKYAAHHLNVLEGPLRVKYEGQRTDGTHAVNGDIGYNIGVTFQCSFNSNGNKVVRFTSHSPEGCPPDVSEADRYKYPDCN